MTDIDTCCRRYDCPHLLRGGEDEPPNDLCIILDSICTHTTTCAVLAKILRERMKPDPNAPIRRMRSMNTADDALTLNIETAGTNTSSNIWEYVCPWCDGVFPTQNACFRHINDYCRKKSEEE